MRNANGSILLALVWMAGCEPLTPPVADAPPAAAHVRVASDRALMSPEGPTASPRRIPSALQIRPSDRGLEVDFSLPAFQLEEVSEAGEAFLRIRAAGLGVNSEVGLPELPLYSFYVALPEGSVRPEVQTTVLRASRSRLVSRIFPVQPPWPKNRPLAERPFVIEKAYYLSRGQKKPLVSVSAPFVVRGVRGVMITLRPFAYNPKDQLLSVTPRARLSIPLHKGNPWPCVTQESSRKLLGLIFVNFSGEQAPSCRGKDAENYLVISAPEWAAGLADLLRLRQEQGYQVDLFTTDTTGADAASIKAFILKRYLELSTRPSFVLLVGDTDRIPSWRGQAPSDLPYVTLDGTDPHPDATIGRISVSSAPELAQIVHKTLAYESELGSWPMQNLFLASRDNSTISEGTHNYVIKEYFDPNGYQSIKDYHARGATTAGVIADLEEGQRFVVYSGHGVVDGWTDGPPLYREDITPLAGTVFPIVLSFACLTGSYQEKESFGETWLRSKNGASAFVGASVPSLWDPDDILERNLFQVLFREGISRLGTMLDVSKMLLYSHYAGEGSSKQYYEMYNLLGDPALDVHFEDAVGPRVFLESLTVNGTVIDSPGPDFVAADKEDVPVAPDGSFEKCWFLPADEATLLLESSDASGNLSTRELVLSKKSR